MKPIEFQGQNTVIAKDQPQYLPLPALRIPHITECPIICCWKLTWCERFRVLMRGVVWHHILTFGQPLQPQILETTTPAEVIAELEASKRAAN